MPRSAARSGSVGSVSLPGLAALLFTACGGGNGDAQSTPIADEYGNGARLAELIGAATWLDPTDTDSARCSPPPARRAYVTGATLVAIDDFDETGDGAHGNLYVQDSAGEPAAYAGVTVFQPSFSPPDLRLVAGDVVDMFGDLTEFLGPSVGKFGFCRTLPEVGGTMSFRFEGSHVAPKPLRVEDLKSYASARQYIGMLVRVEQVSIAGDPSSSGGRYLAALQVGAGVPATDVPKISNELYDLQAEGPPLAAGTSFRAVTGIVTYFYGFKLAPRSKADFEP